MSWEDNVRRVVPYTPGEQPRETDVIKLNTNENPYPPSPRVGQALARLDSASLRLYPDPGASSLVHAIAARYALSDEEVFAGVGSDDVLAMCFMTFFNSDRPILFPDITYSFYDVWAELLRIPYRQIPLDGHFDIVPEDYRQENGGIVFPNPNAPTGALMPVSAIETVVRDNPGSVVIVDEAYIDFGGESALPLIHRYDNVIVTRTFSKSRSLAGMRIGYAMGNAKLIRYLNDVKFSFNSYTMNRAAIAAGTAAVGDEAYFRECCRKIISTRERFSAELRDLGFRFRNSSANFVFVSHPDVPAKEIFDYLKTKKIYVRWWDKPRISNYLRITVGTDEEMDTLVRVLRDLLAKRA